MLSVNLIGRHFEAGDWDRLLRDLAENGLPLPLPLRVRLSQGSTPALALALMRLTELTYGPTPLGRRMIAALLHQQRADGGFGEEARADPLATATAAAAMGQVLRDQPGAADERLRAGRAQALAALAALQNEQGLFDSPADRTDEDRALAAAFVLLLLGDDAAFRETVRFAELRSWFEEHAREVEPGTVELYRLAQLNLPTPRPRPAAA